MYNEPTRAAEPTETGNPRSRMDWVDNLRTAMIVLVVNMHACVTYSHVGGWFITLAPEPSLPEKIPFILWQAHLQSFFMGLLFFIASYFAEKSIVKKGAGFSCASDRSAWACRHFSGGGQLANADQSGHPTVAHEFHRPPAKSNSPAVLSGGAVTLISRRSE